MRALPVLLLPLLLLAACSAPPQKEIDLAQGALDAARAAGAEQYATEQYTDATAALQGAHDAVAQRDYRLALTRALDAHDRAQDAARGAADGKARARGQAEAVTAAAAAAVNQLRTRIKVAEDARVVRKDLEAARQVVDDTDAAVQKARAAIKAEDYVGAQEAVKGVPARIATEIAAIDELVAKRAARPARRPR